MRYTSARFSYVLQLYYFLQFTTSTFSCASGGAGNARHHHRVAGRHRGDLLYDHPGSFVCVCVLDSSAEALTPARTQTLVTSVCACLSVFVFVRVHMRMRVRVRVHARL